ncbi:MAG: DNA repair protein RadC [Bacteroidota bacterium]
MRSLYMSTPVVSLNTVHSWAPNDRPREKLLLNGRASLSDAELLAILLGSGSEGSNAVDLARSLLTKAGHNLNTLAEFSAAELMQQKGIGEAKAMTIMAAMELARRRRLQEPARFFRINSSRDAHELLCPEFIGLRHEEFWVLMVNRANGVLGKKRISSGGVGGTVADPKMIFRTAIESLASGIIVAHNHPSGNLEPSKEDINLTCKLKGAGKMLDIQFIDHLIIAGNNYHSFADSGTL